MLKPIGKLVTAFRTSTKFLPIKIKIARSYITRTSSDFMTRFLAFNENITVSESVLIYRTNNIAVEGTLELAFDGVTETTGG